VVGIVHSGTPFRSNVVFMLICDYENKRGISFPYKLTVDLCNSDAVFSVRWELSFYVLFT
jgi:hypothetical protein